MPLCEIHGQWSNYCGGSNAACPQCHPVPATATFDALRNEGVQWAINHLLDEAVHLPARAESWRLAANWIKHHNPYIARPQSAIEQPEDEGEIAEALNDIANGYAI